MSYLTNELFNNLLIINKIIEFIQTPTDFYNFSCTTKRISQFVNRWYKKKEFEEKFRDYVCMSYDFNVQFFRDPSKNNINLTHKKSLRLPKIRDREILNYNKIAIVGDNIFTERIMKFFDAYNFVEYGIAVVPNSYKTFTDNWMPKHYKYTYSDLENSKITSPKHLFVNPNDDCFIFIKISKGLPVSAINLVDVDYNKSKLICHFDKFNQDCSNLFDMTILKIDDNFLPKKYCDIFNFHKIPHNNFLVYHRIKNRLFILDCSNVPNLNIFWYDPILIGNEHFKNNILYKINNKKMYFHKPSRVQIYSFLE